jgi:addiction module RelE/StbE family toxin
LQLFLSKQYKKKEKKFFSKHQDLLPIYSKVLKKLKNNPFDNSLKTHKLKGDLKEFYACSLTYEYRIIMTIYIEDEKIYLIDIGTHDKVY